MYAIPEADAKLAEAERARRERLREENRAGWSPSHAIRRPKVPPLPKNLRNPESRRR